MTHILSTYLNLPKDHSDVSLRVLRVVGLKIFVELVLVTEVAMAIGWFNIDIGGKTQYKKESDAKIRAIQLWSSVCVFLSVPSKGPYISDVRKFSGIFYLSFIWLRNTV